MLALLLATAALQVSSVFGQETPPQCFANSNSVSDLVTCLDKFTARSGYYTPQTYDGAQPTEQQRDDFSSVIKSLLDANKNCGSAAIPGSLKDIYAIRNFKGNCVLYEKSSIDGTYVKGWGTLITPRSILDVQRNVHFSAPHPGWESQTIQQAASLFELTESKSLFVPGRNHNASTEISECITDLRIIKPMSQSILVAIYEWQRDHDGCPASSCAFIQLRGMKQSTCPDDAIFLSAGLGRSPSSIQWYTDSTPRPVKALQESLQASFPQWNKKITLPSDSKCVLTGTENIVGRYLNGVNDVCHSRATSETATGYFIQVDQVIAARREQAYNSWSQAVKEAFPAIN